MLTITPIATTLDVATMAAFTGAEGGYPHGFEPTPGTMPADALSEFAGRACYQSWSRPNPATADNDGYMANIIDHGHFSVLEHASVTVYVEGVSRALTHELVRHRHFSPSQLSQRFVDSSTVRFVIPPALRDMFIDGHPGSTAEQAEDYWQTFPTLQDALVAYEEIYEALTAGGYDRKQAREAARAVLPNCTETKIVLTGNLRCWREFFAKRRAEGVDAEMREFADAAFEVVRKAAPAAFQDLA